MSNYGIEQAMANNVLILIREVIESGLILEGNFITNIEKSDDNKEFILKDKNGNYIEYSLSEISNIFSDEFEGLYDLEGNIFDYINEVKSENKKKYESLSKEEFINYIGRLYYLQYKCEEVYAKLKELEMRV